MHVQRFTQLPSFGSRPLQLAPATPVGAAWIAPQADAMPLAQREGDCLLVAAHGALQLDAGGARTNLSAGDAAVVHGAQACSVRALAAGTHALVVWLARAQAAAGPRIVPQREHEAKATVEFNTRFRRLPLLPGSAPIDWGSAIADIAPRDATAPHSHVDDESFVLLSGRGRLRVGDESQELRAGDVAHLPSGSLHTLENLGAQPLRFFCTWWTQPTPRAGDCIDSDNP